MTDESDYLLNGNDSTEILCFFYFSAINDNPHVIIPCNMRNHFLSLRYIRKKVVDMHYLRSRRIAI